MEVKLFFWSILIAFILAEVEIQIEGKDGWAKNLPTWKIENKLTKLLFNGGHITGYHFWMFLMILILLHFPFLFISWSISLEFKILASYSLLVTLEDFLWFVLNPYYGIKKFNSKNIPWHKNWIGPVPSNYIIGIAFGISFIYLSQFFL